MNSMFGKIALSVASVGAMVLATTPAEAQRGRGGYYRGGGGGWHGGGHWGGRGYYRGDRTGLAIGAGLLGLGVGAAIASSNRGYYGGGYYGGGYYGGAPYYGGYYAPGYYAPGPYYGYAPRCWNDRQWDGYGWRRVRVCD